MFQNMRESAKDRLQQRSWLVGLAFLLTFIVSHAAENELPILSAASRDRAEQATAWRTALAESRAAIREGDHTRAEALLVGLLDTPRAADAPRMLRARANDELADLYRETDRPELAIPLYLQSIPTLKQLLGPGQPRIAVSLHNLGVCHGRVGDPAAARQVLDEALELWSVTTGADSENYANTMRAWRRFVRNN